jgi:hypothetical protein
MTALPSMPLWFKRAGPLLPANTANESDVIAFNGRLILATFNRPPMVQQVSFYDISDISNPVLLAQRAWAGAMGSMLVDTSGSMHIYGSSPSAQNDAPYNSIIHSSVDANWNLSAPNTIIGPSGMGFNNLGAAVVPGGYIFAVEQAYSNGNKAESFCFSTTPDFASLTWKSAFYNPGTTTVDFTGRSRIRHMPDGWNYVTSDTSAGYCQIARTQDFVTFKFCTAAAFGFLGPDFGDAYTGPGGTPKYDGNVSWEEWTLNGQPCVIVIWFQSNETNDGELRVGIYNGTLASLFSRFTFQP